MLLSEKSVCKSNSVLCRLAHDIVYCRILIVVLLSYIIDWIKASIHCIKVHQAVLSLRSDSHDAHLFTLKLYLARGRSLSSCLTCNIFITSHFGNLGHRQFTNLIELNHVWIAEQVDADLRSLSANWGLLTNDALIILLDALLLALLVSASAHVAAS